MEYPRASRSQSVIAFPVSLPVVKSLRSIDFLESGFQRQTRSIFDQISKNVSDWFRSRAMTVCTRRDP